MRDYELHFYCYSKEKKITPTIGEMPADQQLSKLTDLIELTSFFLVQLCCLTTPPVMEVISLGAESEKNSTFITFTIMLKLAGR